MYLAIKNVKSLTNYRLLLTFENDEDKIFDVTPYLETDKFSELKNISLFDSVSVCFDSIEWANHLDLDPEFLYTNSESIESHNQKIQLTV